MAYDRDQILSRIHNIISANPEISLHQLCEALGMERHTVQRLIKEKAKLSFRCLRKRLRLGIADEMVKQGVSIKVTAHICGYAWPSNLSRAMKRNEFPGDDRRLSIGKH